MPTLRPPRLPFSLWPRRAGRPAGGRAKPLGQSLVEFALFLPILVMLLGGLVEFGFGLNRFINIVEAAREGARYGSDGQPDPRLDGRDLDTGTGLTNMDCLSTKDFYGKIACVVQQAADPIDLNPGEDEIIITVARVYRSPLCDEPSPPPSLDCTARILPDPEGLWPDPPLDPAPLELNGRWRWTGEEDSQFDRARIQAYIDANALSSGVLIVEVYYRYHMVLNLPWITPFLDPNGQGIRFYTYTIIPVPAGEPRPTPTPTFTPTNTLTPTPTNTYTPTPGPTPTPTLTPTETPTPTPTDTPPPTATNPACNAGYVSAAKSSLTFVTGRQWPDYAWADDAQTLRLQVVLVGDCDEALAGRTVNLRTDRPGSDTIVFDQAVGNSYFFSVRSRTVGLSSYTAYTEVCPASDPICAGRENPLEITIPLTPSIGHYVCVYGQREISTSANTLVIAYNNPSPSGTFAWPPRTDRRLIRLAVEWPAALSIERISFGSTANVIWTGSPVAGPSGSFGDGTIRPWTSFNRSMVFSPVKALQLVFNQPITPGSGTYTYRVIATWDDSLGGSVCTSDQVTITLP